VYSAPLAVARWARAQSDARSPLPERSR
jgi:hypothetical protein